MSFYCIECKGAYARRNSNNKKLCGKCYLEKKRKERKG